ncbi:MAG: hypothetical protein LH629_09235, partial [Ignavibacteria bacterium]|nr:hypothetical protein [Ignavibacteria bacterium]
MNTKKLLFISTAIISILIFTSFDNYKDDPDKLTDNNIIPNLPYTIASTQMNANNISTWYRNNGSFNRDPSTGNSGFEWPKGSQKFARYASGMWIGAIVGDDTLICIAEYDYEYLPGYIDNNGNPLGKDDPTYKIYTINKGDSVSADYQNWPNNQGAYINERGKPYLIGNQTMFYSYTDGYPESHQNNAGSTAPMKAVILQTNWSFKQNYGFLNDVIFTEYRIINKGNLPWTKCYIAQWTDDDLGNATDDANGCDSVLNLGYIYNIGTTDGVYGTQPPAVGFLNLRGGTVVSPGDTVKYFSPPGSNNLITKPNQKNLYCSSVLTILKSVPIYGDPSNYIETYNCLQGKASAGIYWINPLTGNISRYQYSGDPEANTGWLMEYG